MKIITKIDKVDLFNIFLTFNGSEQRVLNLKDIISQFSTDSFVYKKLSDQSYFASVKLDSYGTLIWNNEIDFCPDTLYENSKEI
ncbi:MAG: DUF2442 domain-containing protein [Bacteroidota bacterium]|jgi:hypothetical protein